MGLGQSCCQKGFMLGGTDFREDIIKDSLQQDSTGQLHVTLLLGNAQLIWVICDGSPNKKYDGA
eukprot:5690809-Amphidinium_carterae.1